MVSMDWENGYVECSAMFNSNISAVFRALLHQARCDIYVISTLSTHYLHIIYRSGLVPLLPGCLVTDGAADSANNRNTRGLGPKMRRRQSLPIGQHTTELLCSYTYNCEVFISTGFALKFCETVVCVSYTHSCQFKPNQSSQCPIKKL